MTWAFIRPATEYHGAYRPARMSGGKDMITDGLSNTIAFVEAGTNKAVPWTKPDDLLFDYADPLAIIWDGSRRVYPCGDGRRQSQLSIPMDIEPSTSDGAGYVRRVERLLMRQRLQLNSYKKPG